MNKHKIDELQLKIDKKDRSINRIMDKLIKQKKESLRWCKYCYTIFISEKKCREHRNVCLKCVGTRG